MCFYHTLLFLDIKFTTGGTEDGVYHTSLYLDLTLTGQNPENVAHHVTYTNESC